MGNTFFIYRKTVQTQALDLTENDNLPAQSLEQQYDKLFGLIGDLFEITDRCIKVNLSDGSITTLVANKVDRANTTLGFDADGDVELT